MYPTKPRSNLWYIAPILFGIIGGIVAFFILRKDDPIKARNCLLIGIGMMFVGILIDIAFLSQIQDMPDSIRINS